MTLIVDLVKISSVSGHEETIQKWIIQKLAFLEGKPFWVGKNIVVCIPGIDRTKALIFNSHVDTVPVGNTNLWKHDPFGGEIVGKKIYGLGASDEKAVVATLILLAEMYAVKKPACDIWLTFVVHEEIDGSGTAEFVNWFMKHCEKKYQKLGAILGEPTNLAKIEIAHKGNVFVKATIHGDSGHGSKPEAIKNHAAKEMYNVVNKLDLLSKEWKKNYFDPVLGAPTIGFTSISAGNASSPNKFPDTCIATFDVRTTPQLHAKVISLIQKKLGKRVDVSPMFEPVLYGSTNPDNLLVKIFQTIAKKPLGISTGSNDLCFFTAVGIPGVVFGPGDPACIHQPNEFCNIKNIQLCAAIYSKVISAWGFKLLNS